MDADKPAQRKSYAGNTTLEIFEVLWRHSYFGHGLTVRQILDELARKHQLEDPSELPTEKTIRNQLKKLTATVFLGRHIGHLTESDLAGIECKNPQPGWYLDAFLSTAESDCCSTASLCLASASTPWTISSVKSANSQVPLGKQ